MSQEFDLLELTVKNVDEVFELYRDVFSRTPAGFLAERSLGEFSQILGRDGASACVSAWHNGELVGYALSSREDDGLHISSPLLKMAYGRGEKVQAGKGLVIAPEYRGKGLFKRLAAFRAHLARQNGSPHIIGFVAVSNFASLLRLMESRSWLVGLEPDEQCLNFVVYHGSLMDELVCSNECVVPLDDTHEIFCRLSLGWIGCSLGKGLTGKLKLVMRHCPALMNSGRGEPCP